MADLEIPKPASWWGPAATIAGALVAWISAKRGKAAAAARDEAEAELLRARANAKQGETWERLTARLESEIQALKLDRGAMGSTISALHSELLALRAEHDELRAEHEELRAEHGLMRELLVDAGIMISDLPRPRVRLSPVPR